MKNYKHTHNTNMEEPPASVAAAAPNNAAARPTAQQLKQIGGKRSAAAHINTDLATASAVQSVHATVVAAAANPLLDEFLHLILHPEQRIDDSDNIEWCKYLIAGGRTPAEFAAIGKQWQIS